MLEFLALAQECAPTVAPQTMAAVVNVESSYNPYAIGVVGGRLARQPKSREEAVATAQQLESDGWNFSLGVAQVNRYNLPKYQITYEQAFDACTSLRVGSKILEDCYVRASKRTPEPQAALHAAFSCYYSGNFTRGFKPDVAGKPSYVQKVLASAGVQPQAIPVVPSIQTAAAPSRSLTRRPAQRPRLLSKLNPRNRLHCLRTMRRFCFVRKLPTAGRRSCNRWRLVQLLASPKVSPMKRRPTSPRRPARPLFSKGDL